MEYLPRYSTVADACAWLQHRTGEQWVLPRLLEIGLMPWFWLDYMPGWPAIFGDRKQGYLAPMPFIEDTWRLEADGTALVTMTRTHAGELMKVEPGIRVYLSDLRFKHEDLQEIAAAARSSRNLSLATDGVQSLPERTSDEPQPERALPTGPAPLTTSNIAFCFAGLRHWDEQQWKKTLGNKPKWLAGCVAIAGARGVKETEWNPVLIGAALVDGSYARANSVRARFQSKPMLKPWFDAWKTHEADYIDTL